MAKLKIGGTWAGVIEVVLEEWTVPMLRIEVAKRSNCGPESSNFICAGKVLRDGDGTEKLAQLGVKNNARILASRGSIEEGKSLEEGLLAEEERSRRLSRVKHLRLELLEGVVAYHNVECDRSRKALTSAHAKYFQLQVPDEALSLVMSMGFKERDATRALQMSNQDVGSAVDFLVEEKAKRPQKREEDIRRRTEIMSLLLKHFEEMRMTLRTDPEANSAIQVDIGSRKRKRTRQASETAIEQLVRMGFERSRVVAALQAGGTIEQAMHQLLSQSDSNPTVGADNSANSSAPILPDASGSSNDVGGPSTASEAEERDAEMEDALAGELAKGDALTDYDIEVTNEGEAINEYLTLLESAGNSVEASRQ